MTLGHSIQAIVFISDDFLRLQCQWRTQPLHYGRAISSLRRLRNEPSRSVANAEATVLQSGMVEIND